MESCEQEIIVLHRKWKKIWKSEVKEIDLEKNDFHEEKEIHPWYGGFSFVIEVERQTFTCLYWWVLVRNPLSLSDKNV